MGSLNGSDTEQQTTTSVKVLQLVTQLEPAGAQSMARWLHDKLDVSNEISTVFLYEKSASDLFPTPELVVRERPSSPLSLIRFLKQSLRLRQRRPEVVLAHTHFSIALATLLWGRKPGVALIPVHHWPIERYPASVRRIMQAARKRGMYAEEIYVSPAVVDRQPATVIPNPVPAPGPYAEAPDLPADIIIVARHAEEKGIDTAITAMQGMPDRHLTLVGGGPLTDQLVKLADDKRVSEQVTFAGRLTNPQVRGMMRRARVFLLPSRWEAMPIALLEAIAEDCVIVASEIEAHQFLLAKNAAIGFTQNDPASLQHALSRATDDSTVPALVAGRAKVQEEYNEDRIAHEWLEAVRRAKSRLPHEASS